LNKTDVVVVGAGPVGLSLAMRLGLNGVRVLLLEANSSIERDLRASTFHPPTLDLFDEQGITPQLIREGIIAPTWQVRNHPSHDCAEFDLSILEGHTAHPYRLQCEQWRLSEFLKTYIENQLPHVEIKMGVSVEGLSQTLDAVTVQASSESGLKESWQSQYLVGCDGAKSIVRKTLNLTFEGETFPETTLLVATDFPFHEHLPHLSYINYCWSPHGTFSLLRLKHLWRVSLYPHLNESIEEASKEASVREKLCSITPQFGHAKILEVRPYRIHQRVVKQYVQGRVVLAGDAAHINSPSGGMGMNGGVHDAFNLADKLARVIAGEGPELLDLYERQRRPIAIKHVIEQSAKNRARMQEKDSAKRQQTLTQLKAIASEPERALEYLLQTSMISGLRESLSRI
jgi:2-polyprenyl-6-methoxyphenol hydroxylase-like FAD-dependent oxidoreductase